MDTDNSTHDNRVSLAARGNGRPLQKTRQSPPEIPSPNLQKAPDVSRSFVEGNNADQIFQHSQTKAEFKIAKLLTKICFIFGIITLIGTLCIVIGPATYPRQYSRQTLALILSLSYTMYDFIKGFGTAFCTAAIVAIVVAGSRYKIQVKRLLITVICSIFMIYLLSIMNGIIFYTHYPEYGTYPFFNNFPTCTGLFDIGM